MILLCHGAFDSRDDRTNGVSKLTDRIRAMGVSDDDPREYDIGNPITFSDYDLLAEPNVWIGFSNGADYVYSRYLELLTATEDPSVTTVQAHFIFLDFVYRGVRQVFDRAPLALPSCVQSCLCLYRTREVGIVPPFHTLISRQDGDRFRNVPVDADHGNLPGAEEAQSKVCERISEIFA